MLRRTPGAEVFSQPPEPQHGFYTEIMNNYIDLAIIEKKFKAGDYSGSFQFVQDIRSVFDKAFRYYLNDPEIVQRA